MSTPYNYMLVPTEANKSKTVTVALSLGKVCDIANALWDLISAMDKDPSGPLADLLMATDDVLDCCTASSATRGMKQAAGKLQRAVGAVEGTSRFLGYPAENLPALLRAYSTMVDVYNSATFEASNG